MEPLDKERLKVRQEQAKKLVQLVHVYEESLEPKVVLLFRRMEEMIARSQMPLTHINLVLDMLKKSCVEMAYTAYVEKGSDKLKDLKIG